MGQGCSRRQVQAMLTYSRTLGHRGQRLPPGYDALWKTVNEVTLLYKQHAGAIVVPYLHLNVQHCHISVFFDHPPCIPDPPQCHSRFMRPCDLVKCVVEVPECVQELMSVPADKITFYHVDPTEALVRLLVAGPLVADPGNLQFFPNEGGLHYDDYADGERMARIQAALPSGTAALTSVLFFDKINRDKKGFSTGEGAILVGGFYKRYENYVS